LRDYFIAFKEQNCEIVVVGPDSARSFAAIWQQEELPFIGLPDPRHEVLDLYHQSVQWFKLGRLPTQAVIDIQGKLRCIYHGRSMADIPAPQSVLERVRTLQMKASQ